MNTFMFNIDLKIKFIDTNDAIHCSIMKKSFFIMKHVKQMRNKYVCGYNDEKTI